MFLITSQQASKGRLTMFSSTPSPNVRVVQCVFDVQAWLLPQMDELQSWTFNTTLFQIYQEIWL